MPMAKIPRETRYCIVCGEAFQVLPRKPNKFCSRACSYIGRSGASLEWKALGRTDQEPVEGEPGRLERMYLSAEVEKSLQKRKDHREIWL